MLTEEDVNNMTVAQGLQAHSWIMKMFKNEEQHEHVTLLGIWVNMWQLSITMLTIPYPIYMRWKSEQNIDAISDINKRYSIKATRTKTTGVFNGLNDPDSDMSQEQLFEYVIVVLFDEDVSLQAIYEVDWEAFMLLKKWNSSKRAYYLSVSNELKRKAKIIYER